MHPRHFGTSRGRARLTASSRFQSILTVPILFTRIQDAFVPVFRALVIASLLSACGKADAARVAAPRAPSDTLTDAVLMARADLGRYEGSPTARIWIVMVSDFQCPYCRDWHDSTLTQVRQTYVETGKARLAYLNLPLQGHRHAVAMAKAALCAASQEKFWPYADAMFSRQKTVANLGDVQPLLHTLADSLKLDTAAFTHCNKSSAVTALLNSDLRQANQANIRSTPSFFVGQFLLEGAVPFPSFKKAVDSALVIAEAKAKTPAPGPAR